MQNHVELKLGEATVQVPAEAAARAYLEKLMSPPTTPLSAILCATPAPAIIGAQWRGGICAGRTLDNNEPFELLLLPGEFEGSWSDALAWAEKQGGVLPSRIDQLLLWKNLPDEFKKEAYWSAEQNAGDSVYAWYQYFGNGLQYCNLKYDALRARAVRRLVIQ